MTAPAATNLAAAFDLIARRKHVEVYAVASGEMTKRYAFWEADAIQRRLAGAERQGKARFWVREAVDWQPDTAPPIEVDPSRGDLPIHKVLGGLQELGYPVKGPRATSGGVRVWRSRCPEHRSSTPGSTPLSVRAFPDGHTWVMCFGGCPTRDIVPHLGMEVRDLFLDHGDYAADREAELRELAGHSNGAAPAKPAPQLLTADSAEPEAIEWWWPGYIPIGKPGLLDGDPGLGKSLIWTWLVASMTAGRTLPDGKRPATTGPAIVFAPEDGYRDTIIPRLMAAGADRKRIIVAHAADYGTAVVLPRDIAFLTELIERFGARMLVFDPLEVYVDADIIKGREQRAAMAPLIELVAARRIVMLGTRHLNQQSGQKAQYRGRGDITAIGLARWGFIVGHDPKDEDQDARVMVPHKANLARRAPGIKYRVDGATIAGGIETAVVKWGGQTEVTADQAIGADQSRSQTAKEVIEQEILPNLPMLGKDAFAVLNGFGIKSSDTINRAKKKLGIKSERADFVGPWWWVLEGHSPPSDAQGSGDPYTDSSDSWGPAGVSEESGESGDTVCVSIGRKGCPRCGNRAYQEVGDGRRRCHGGANACGTVYEVAS